MSFSVALRETSPPYTVPRPHVILVEDDDVQGWSISRLIERLGADCTLIVDLAEAEQAIPQLLSTEQPYRPTILLMDQQLPYDHAHGTGVDGWTLMAELLGQMHDGVLHPALLVAISADLYGENRDFYNQQIGAHACFEKPLRDHHVQELLKQVQGTVPLLPPPLPEKRPDEPQAQQRWSIGDMGRRALQGLRQMVRRQQPEMNAETLQAMWRRDGDLSQEALRYLQTLNLTFDTWVADRAVYLDRAYPTKLYGEVFTTLCTYHHPSAVARNTHLYTERNIYRIEKKIIDALLLYEYQQQKAL